MIKYFFLFVFWVYACSSVKADPCNSDVDKADTSIRRIQVFKITTTKEAYIIYALNKGDSSQFAIVSLKKKSRAGEKIKTGSTYELRLSPCYEKETFPDHMVVYEIIVSGKNIIVPSEGWASNVFTSPDLIGLKLNR